MAAVNGALRDDVDTLVSKPTNQTGHEHGIASLSEHLKDVYRKSFEDFQPLWWKEYTLSQLHVKAELTRMGEGGTCRSVTADYDLLFCGGDCARRIRIEGEPAAGKTTLCRKLAYDWAVGRMRHFRLVFLLGAKDLYQGAIVDAIFAHLLRSDVTFSKEEIWGYVTNNPESVLFIFDDFDAMCDTTSDNEAKRIVTGKLLSGSTVIVTSKPRQRTCPELSDFESQFVICGLSSESCELYIDKYFHFQGDHSEGSESLASTVKSSLEGAGERLIPSSFLPPSISPLHLAFLCLLWEDFQSKGYFPSRSAELCSSILRSIHGRCCVTRGSHSGNAGQRLCEDKTKKVARVALEYLKEGGSSSDINGVCDFDVPVCLSMSGLVRFTDHSHDQRQPHRTLAFCHRLWLEYFAALDVSYRVKTSDVSAFKEVEFLFNDLESNYQVLLFSVGLLGSKSGPIFRGIANQALNAWGNDKSSMRMEKCLQLLSECKYYNSEILGLVSPHVTQIVCLNQKPSLQSIANLHRHRRYACKTSPRVVEVSVLSHACFFQQVMDLLRHQCSFSKNYPITVKIEHFLLGFRSRGEILAFSKALENDEISLASLTVDAESVRATGASECLGVALRETSSLEEIVVRLDSSPDGNRVGQATKLLQSACQNKDIKRISVEAPQSSCFHQIPFEDVEKNGPEGLNLECGKCDLNDAVMNRVWRLFRRCRKTTDIRYVFHAMRNCSSHDKIDALKDSLKHPSKAVTSLTFGLPRAPDSKLATCDVINDALHILATNATLEDLEIGLESSNIPKLCDLITNNGHLRSLVCCFDADATSSLSANAYTLLTNALRGNSTLTSFAVQTACRYPDAETPTVSRSEEEPLVAMVTGLLRPVRNLMEKRQVTLTALKCTTLCKKRARFDSIQPLMAKSSHYTRWSYKVNELSVSDHTQLSKFVSFYRHEILVNQQVPNSQVCQIQ